MEKIASFKIDHTRLNEGVYVSKKDYFNGVCVTTFDIRMTKPNREPPMQSDAIHTIEHLGATYLRSSAFADKIVYFGPMGCKTGFYLVAFGDLAAEEIAGLVAETFEFIAGFEGEIPGASPAECGNYLFQNLPTARYYAEKFIKEFKACPRFDYPE